MKIDRVILASNENINYYPFWNPLSRIYKENFNIQPTLIWFGSEEDIQRLGLSREYGDIIIQEISDKFHIGWQAAYAPFYFTKFFEDDVVTTMGIDQVPLSDLFLIKMIEDATDEDYVTLIDDAYLPKYWAEPNGTSPSAYHAAKGKIFNQVYSFEDNFFDELEKINSHKVERDYDINCAFWQSGEQKWGLDESWTSKKLREYRDIGGSIKCYSNFSLLRERRIDCIRSYEVPFDEIALTNGYYSESHMCRPYINHKTYLDRMFSLIPKYKN